MSRSLSSDLRSRVISAIEEGRSTREAARRFRIGIATAGSWYRRYRRFCASSSANWAAIELVMLLGGERFSYAL
jgi:transposase